MLSKIIAAFGMLLLLAAAYVCIQAIRAGANMQLLSLPVSLAQGTITTPQFKTEFDLPNYEILATWDEKVGGKNLDPMLVDVSWELFEGTKIAEGSSADTTGLRAPSRIRWEEPIGSFAGRKGHRYRLALHVNRDASELNVAHPRIIVQVPQSRWEDFALGTGVLLLITGALGTVGIALLAVAFAISKSKTPGNTPTAADTAE